MRLSLLSDDNDVAELLINKAMELMSQAETAEAEGESETMAGHDRGAALTTTATVATLDESS